MCRNEIIIMMERERVLSWPELCLTGSWPALDPFTLYADEHTLFLVAKILLGSDLAKLL